MSDEELLDAWSAGDSSAGERLVDRHFVALHRFLNNKAPTRVDDLVQETFKRCLEARQRFRRQSTFRSFLFGIANNVVREAIRAGRRDSVDFSESSVVQLGGSPSMALHAVREQARMMDALRMIPVDYQMVLELYYWENLDGGEIAEVLGVPEPTVRTWLRRGKQRLRELLQESESALDKALTESGAIVVSSGKACT